MRDSEDNFSRYLADHPISITSLRIKKYFNCLNDWEKLYAHHMSVAGFSGTRILLRQVSPECEGLYDLIIGLNKACGGNWSYLRLAVDITEEEMNLFLEFAAQFLGCMGNYRDFGDTKIFPRLHATVLRAIASITPQTRRIYDSIEGQLLAYSPHELLSIGFPEQGHVSNFYPNSPNITTEEIILISDFLQTKNFLTRNTRLRKVFDGYEVLIASAQKSPAIFDRDLPESEWTLEGRLKGRKIHLVYGDHAYEMSNICLELMEARKYACNDNQRAMIDAYIKSFRTGSLLAHKESQRYWIRDKSPVIECNLGFILTYRDPLGEKACWMGFVSIVNKKLTQTLMKFVAATPQLLPKLPWSIDFEKDSFNAPDFTSLEVLSYSTNGLPTGANLPIYDDIRATKGFKNISLANVMRSRSTDQSISFIHHNDLDLYRNLLDDSLDVVVGLHELLGHGSGKLLQEYAPGKFNFDIKHPPLSPLNGRPVNTYYKYRETFSSLFKSIAASYEECRAECVAMYLICDFQVLKIFGYGDGLENMSGEAGDIIFVTYLKMAHDGLSALAVWDPETHEWGQAHMRARFSMLQVLLQAGSDCVRLEYTRQDLSDLIIRIDRDKILSHARPAIRSYLQQLHIYKSTANAEHGAQLFTSMSEVDDFMAKRVRPVVLRRQKPRENFVQCNTVLVPDPSKTAGYRVDLIEYEATPEGMIQSFADRTYI